MKPSDFDEFLLSVYYVPFLRLSIAVDYVTRFEESFGVEGLGVGFRIFEVACGDCGSSDEELSSNIISCDFFSIIINDPATSVRPFLLHEQGRHTWRLGWATSAQRFQYRRPLDSGTLKRYNLFPSFPKLVVQWHQAPIVL